ncbi:MAG: sulfur carrier protein ThiS [Salinivenus sp.]
MSSATDTRITVTVNGEEHSLPAEYPLVDVLTDLEIDPEEATGVAVAINESVIRQQDWDDVTLADEDTVEVIQAQQGG